MLAFYPHILFTVLPKASSQVPVEGLASNSCQSAREHFLTKVQTSELKPVGGVQSTAFLKFHW